MKALFKYAFLSGLYVRGPAFAVIFIIYALFILFGSLGLLPVLAHFAGVSLGGIAVAVMLAANIGGDISIARKMFAVPESYLHMLTPVPRGKILLTGVIAMAVMDILTMVFVIFAQAWLAINLAGNIVINGETHDIQGLLQGLWENINVNNTYLLYGIYLILFIIAFYFLVIMIILFCATIKKSLFYKIPASGLLSFLVACGCFYAANLLQLLLAPFSEVQRFGIFIIVSPGGGVALPLLILLTLIEAAGLFILTSKLLERKINL